MQEDHNSAVHSFMPNAGFASAYHDLLVFQKAFAVSKEIHRATLSFPKIEQFAQADQLRRSSKSVCANIVEGFGRQQYSRADFNRFLVFSIGSANETLLWLDYALKFEYIKANEAKKWKEQYISIIRMLHKLRNSK